MEMAMGTLRVTSTCFRELLNSCFFKYLFSLNSSRVTRVTKKAKVGQGLQGLQGLFEKKNRNPSIIYNNIN